MKCILSLLSLLPLFVAAQQYDVLITNGKILDGTGNHWFYSDLAVKDGKIIAIGKLKQQGAKRVIDAKGLMVAPGFIDVHTHIEGEEKRTPTAENFIYDGVTTVVTGNCGSSQVDMKKYFAFIDSLKTSINVASLIGHNDVRRTVLGRAMKDPTEAEMQQMILLVEEAMKNGAVGFSTGLIYIPGTYSKPEEVIRLAGAAAKYNGVYASHIRNEGDSVAVAIREAINIGYQNKMPVEISHFKVSGQQNWGRSKETITMIETAEEMVWMSPLINIHTPPAVHRSAH
jgi:N-acyl-D-amino-acid deacylase